MNHPSIRTTGTATAAVAMLLASATSPADIIFSDNFNDGDRTANPTWYLVKAESSAPVVNDAVFNSNAMEFNNLHSGGDPTFPPFAQKGVVAGFPQVALQVGESLVLSFDFRLQSVITQSGNLRFGIARNGTLPENPTPFTADGTANGSSAGDDDPSYFVGLSTGTSTGVAIREDNGTTSGFLAGSDIVPDKATGSFSINDTAVHSFEFTIERTDLELMALAVELDGNVIASGVDNFSIKTILNEVGLVSTHRDLDFVVDEITLTYNAIPEPASLTATLAGLSLLAGRRRR